MRKCLTGFFTRFCFQTAELADESDQMITDNVPKSELIKEERNGSDAKQRKRHDTLAEKENIEPCKESEVNQEKSYIKV